MNKMLCKRALALCVVIVFSFNQVVFGAVENYSTLRPSMASDKVADDLQRNFTHRSENNPKFKTSSAGEVLLELEDGYYGMTLEPKRYAQLPHKLQQELKSIVSILMQNDFLKESIPVPENVTTLLGDITYLEEMHSASFPNRGKTRIFTVITKEKDEDIGVKFLLFPDSPVEPLMNISRELPVWLNSAQIGIVSKKTSSKTSSAGLSPTQLRAFEKFYDPTLTTDQMNARRLEELIDKGLLTTSKFFWMEDELRSVDMQDTVSSLLKGELNIYIYSAGEATRMMESLVRYGLVPQADSTKPEVLRKYRRWNTDIWGLVELIHSNKASLESLLKQKEQELSRLLESDKRYKDTKTDVATLKVLVNISNNYTEVPDYARHLTIGPRHIQALVDGIRAMAKKHGFDAKEVLLNLKLTLGVNNEILEDAQEDLKANNFFGLNPANIVFVMNDFAPAYKLVNGEFVLVNENEIHTNYNHGFNIINANTPNSSYIYDANQDRFVLQEERAFTYLLSLKKPAKTTLIHRSNDLITMVPKCALDIEMYALYRILNKRPGLNANVMVEVLNNLPDEDGNVQKGGLLLARKDRPDGLGLLAEGSATKTVKVKKALARLAQQYKEHTDVDTIPYNRLYQYFDIADAQANLDANNNLMPMSIKDEAKTPDGKKTKGFYSPEIPTGDQTILEGSKTVGVMRRKDFLIDNGVLPADKHYTPGNGTLIHDFKELANLLAAIAVVDHQDGIPKDAMDAFNKRKYDIKTTSDAIKVIGDIAYEYKLNIGQVVYLYHNIPGYVSDKFNPKVSDLKSGKLNDQIIEFWQSVHHVYMDTSLSKGEREEALYRAARIVARKHELNRYPEALEIWKNGKDILTEFFIAWGNWPSWQSEGEQVWKPALEMAREVFMEVDENGIPKQFWLHNLLVETIRPAMNAGSAEYNEGLVNEVILWLDVKQPAPLKQVAAFMLEDRVVVKALPVLIDNLELEYDPIVKEFYVKAIEAIGKVIVLERADLESLLVMTESAFSEAAPSKVLKAFIRLWGEIKLDGEKIDIDFQNSVRKMLLDVIMRGASDLSNTAAQSLNNLPISIANTLPDFARSDQQKEYATRLIGEMSKEGARTVLSGYVNDFANIEAVNTLERNAGWSVAKIINYNATESTDFIWKGRVRTPHEVKSISPNMAKSGNQQHNYVAKNLRYLRPFWEIGTVHSNPIDIYEDAESGDRVLLKGGNDYTLSMDYIGTRIFQLAGLPTPDVSLVYMDDENNKGLRLAIRFLEGYKDGGTSLPRKYNRDPLLQAGLLFDVLIQSEDRHPSNMLFKTVDWDIHTASSVPDRLFADFGFSGFSRASGGFMPFNNDVTERDIVAAIIGARARMMDKDTTVPKTLNDIMPTKIKGGVVNEAYWSVVSDYQRRGILLYELAEVVNAITDKQIEAIVKSAHLPGSKIGKSTIAQEWIPQLQAELNEAASPNNPVDGFWNRKNPALRQGTIAMLQGLQDGHNGDIQRFMIETIKSRRDSLARLVTTLKTSSAGLSPAQMEQFKAFFDKYPNLSVDQMNAKRLEDLIDKGLLTTSEFFWMEDQLGSLDMKDTVSSLLKGELNIYIYSAGEASRMMQSLVKYGLIPKGDSTKPEVLRKYRRWNTDIWGLVELIQSNKASLESLLKQKEAELAKLLESDKRYKDTKTDVSTLKVLVNIATTYTEAPDYASHITIGPRHIQALVDGIHAMAQKHGFDAKEVLLNLKLTLGVNNEILEDAQEDLKANNFFGLNPANIVFVMNDFAPAYKLVNGEFVLAEDEVHTNYNHGFNIINANTEYSSYIYDPAQRKFVLQQDKALDYLLEQGAKTTLIHRSNDLITMVPECALDIEMYSVYRQLHEEHGANVMVEVLNNFSGQKGGLLLAREDQKQQGPFGLLAEGLATKTDKVKDALKELTQAYQRKGLPGIPYNRLYQYFDIAQFKANLDANHNLMPMSIKDEAKTPDGKKTKGFYSPEIPTGDQTILEGSKTVGVMRRKDFLIDNGVLPADKHYTPGNGTLIHDFKELANLLAAIAIVDNQDKYVKASSAGIVLIGLPGSGKSNTAKILESNYGFTVIGIDMFRKHVSDNTELGKAIRDYVMTGRLIPDKIVNEEIGRVIDSVKPGSSFVFDGLPQTMAQADFMVEKLREKGISIDLVLVHDIKPEDVVQRMDNKTSKVADVNQEDQGQFLDNRIYAYQNIILPSMSKYFNGAVILHIDSSEDKASDQDVIFAISKRANRFSQAHAKLMAKMKEWGDSTKGNEKIAFIEGLAKSDLDYGNNEHFHAETLKLYQSLRRGFRSEDWEARIAEFQDNSTDENKERALDAIQEFLDKAREGLYIGSSIIEDISKLRARIDMLWQLRWLIFNTAVDDVASSLRSKALEYLFECLKGNSGVGDTLWKNGKEVLTECIESKDPVIWKPALERSFEALSNPEESISSQNITESINVIRFENNQELVKRLVHIATEQGRDKVLRLRIIERVIPEIFARSINEKSENFSLLQDQKKEYIKYLTTSFIETHDKDISEALASTLSIIGSTDILSDLVNHIFVLKQKLDNGKINENELAKLVESIGILGSLHYHAYPENSLRDTLVHIALYGGSNINRPKLDRMLASLREESAYALLNIASSSKREKFEPEKVDDMIIQNIHSAKGDSFTTDPTGIIHVMNVKGPRKILVELLAVNGVNYDVIQKMTGKYIDELITLTLRVPSEVAVVAESKPLGIVTDYKQGESIKVNGVLYAYQGILPQSHSNPIELYENMKGHKIITKGGDNYTLMIEAIGHDLFARKGIPVPRMTLHTNSHGKSIVAMEYLDGYLGDLWKLEPRYYHDRKIQDALLLSVLIKDTDRTPWNMMFKRHSFEFTASQAETVEDELMHIDFGGSLFSKAAGGFNLFPSGFSGWKSGSLQEFITTVRHDMSLVVNKAYEEALSDKALMNELAKNLSELSDQEIDEIVLSAVKAVNFDSKDTALAELDLWIAWCEIENRDGFWNRKSRNDRMGPIEMFREMREKIASDESTFFTLIAGMLKSRRDDILNKEFILRPAVFENTKSPVYKEGYEYKWGPTEVIDSNIRRFQYEEGPAGFKKGEKYYLEVSVITENSWQVSVLNSDGESLAENFILQNTSYSNLANTQISKTSSAGTALSERDIERINLAAEAANLTDIVGVIAYNDMTLSKPQRETMQSLIGQGTQGLVELEAKLGCKVKLMSQNTIEDNANTIIISTEDLTGFGFKNVKYFRIDQTQIDTSYVAVTPLIAIAKGLLGFSNKTDQPKLYTALKTALSSLSQGLLNNTEIENAIAAYINGNPMFIKLPPAVSYDYDKLEQLQRQALLVLIAA